MTSKSAAKKTAKKVTKSPAKDTQEKLAVIQTGGKQYVVAEGDTLVTEKIPGKEKEGAKISFGDVLLVDDGKAVKVGTPKVSGSKVDAELVESGRGKKISVIRFKPKSRHFRRKGHRQPYSKVRITKIS